MSKWLIPWQKRGKSLNDTDNLLWRCDRVYVMDNHRLALWCWWQHIHEHTKWSFIHIDRHYDTLWMKLNPWLHHTKPVHKTDLAAFRSAVFLNKNETTALYQWDTIITALWLLHNDLLQEMKFVVADHGEIPEVMSPQLYSPWKLPGQMRYLSEPDEHFNLPTIVDIDIDYFTYKDLDNEIGLVFSEEYIREIGQAVRAGLNSGQFGIVTIALSPDTTGSWALAERILQTLLSELDMAEEFFAGAPS